MCPLAGSLATLCSRDARTPDVSQHRVTCATKCRRSSVQGSKDDDAAAAQAAGLHGAVGVGRSLWRVLAGYSQRDSTARGQVAQLVQPVGTRECFHHHDRPNADVALGWTAVPAPYGNVRAAVANRRERVATEDGCVEQRVHAAGYLGTHL